MNQDRDEASRFRLHLRCFNCECDAFKTIAVPRSIQDADELIESGLLDRVKFHCAECESAIGQIMGVMDGGSNELAA
jgi:hypothetical protein